MINALFILVANLAFFSNAVFGQEEPRESRGQEDPYSCVSAAAALVLAHFGYETNYEETIKQIKVEDDGRASLGELVRFCEKHGLYCKGFQGLDADHVRHYVGQGYVLVFVLDQDGRQHAITLLGSSKRVLVSDLLEPVYEPDSEKLKDELSRGLPCVVIGRSPVPEPVGDRGIRFLLKIGLLVFFCFFLFLVLLRKGVFLWLPKKRGSSS